MSIRIRRHDTTIPEWFALRPSADPECVELDEYDTLGQWQQALRAVRSGPVLAGASCFLQDVSAACRAVASVSILATTHVRFVLVVPSLREASDIPLFFKNTRLTDVIIAEREPAMLLLQAHANDLSTIGVCASALRLLLGRWGPVADSFLEACVVSGFRIAGATQTSTACGVDRSTARRHARANGLVSIRRVTDAARVTCIALLCWHTRLSLVQVARIVGLRDGRAIDATMRRVAGLTFSGIRGWHDFVDEPGRYALLMTALDAYVLMNPQAAGSPRVTPSDRKSAAYRPPGASSARLHG